MVWKEKSSESRVASSLYILSKDKSPFTPFIFSGLLLFRGFSLGELRDFLWVSVKILIVVIWQIDSQTRKQFNVLMWIWKSSEDGQYLHLCKRSLSTQVYSFKKKRLISRYIHETLCSEFGTLWNQFMRFIMNWWLEDVKRFSQLKYHPFIVVRHLNWPLCSHDS